MRHRDLRASEFFGGQDEFGEPGVEREGSHLLPHLRQFGFVDRLNGSQQKQLPHSTFYQLQYSKQVHSVDRARKKSVE